MSYKYDALKLSKVNIKLNKDILLPSKVTIIVYAKILNNSMFLSKDPINPSIWGGVTYGHETDPQFDAYWRFHDVPEAITGGAESLQSR